MLRGLYTSALGMTTQMQRMDVTSNNLANVNTTGFRREGVAAQEFADRFARRINDPGVLRIMDRVTVGRFNQGVFIDEVFTDFTNGAFEVTGGALDLALEGSGFFTINITAADGTTAERFTRDGMFTLGADGMLLDSIGNRVQGQGGDIIVPNGVITINEYGAIFSNDVYVDTLLLTDFENPQSLRQTGDSYFMTTPESIVSGFAGRVEQGMLESSNVNAVREMVEMIALSRAYEANSRMVQIHDQTLQQAVTQIGARGQ